ncbi:MAG: hypothetical protein JW807_02040 [Spirochaetes bacterium]|nr:hypothetical protein [Spirochaetota bacterium]
MIIRTDVMNVSPNDAHRSQESSVRPESRHLSNRPEHSQESEQSRLKTAEHRLGVKRSLGEALSIAQMSQNIIQQAISISSRLKSIASEAISTGKVDSAALNEVMATMRNTLGDFGRGIAAPLRSYAAPPPKIVEMPDLRAEIRSLNDISADIRAGNYSQRGRIDAIQRALNEKMTAFKHSEEKITNLMRETGAGAIGIGRITGNELASMARSVIVNNPGTALAAQGNISPSAADRLMI